MNTPTLLSSALSSFRKPKAAAMKPSALTPDTQALQAAFETAYERELAQSSHGPTPQAALHAAAIACREHLATRWAATQAADARRGEAAPVRRVHYLSMEFLMGRALSNALAALKLVEPLEAKLAAQGQTLADVLEREPDAALGNGGLGRLAACFLDSFAELALPSFGYGLRYRYGTFAQVISQGRQLEQPDDWTRDTPAWELPRPDLRYPVGFGGRVEVDASGERRWLPAERIEAQAFDFIVPAHHSERVSTLRQWQATAAPIAFQPFCQGDYARAARHQVLADAINWVLYPDDSTEQGRELRLKQEAFLVSASLQDLIARHLREFSSLHNLGKTNAIHLNDTHPALAPAELMRLLLDEHGLGWDEAWRITRQAVAYTNHTLMPEALETWPVRMFESLLPRHLEIIYEINFRFLDELKARFPGDDALAARVSLVDEGSHGGERRVRMAYAGGAGLATAINGVVGPALRADEAVDLCRLCQASSPSVSTTSHQRRDAATLAGSRPTRRWPPCSTSASAAAGGSDLTQLEASSKPMADRAGASCGQFLAVKRANKERLAASSQQHMDGSLVRPSRRQPVRRAGEAHPRVQAPAA